MTTEMITLKLEKSFLKNVDAIVEKEGYQSRTEFIRNALREKIEEYNLREALIAISYLKGIAKRKTSDKDLEALREKAFEELDKRIK